MLWSLLNCACHCKDTHFEAIHNDTADFCQVNHIVLATAKIHILKQFTTGNACSQSCPALCLPLQRYTFWSNSQRVVTVFTLYTIVLATAKIHILKQFTTAHKSDVLAVVLCLPLQRYTFWSNSQLSGSCANPIRNCACHCKDTHFEAIHNFVNFFVKGLKLCLPLQRYTFWSNSQRFFEQFYGWFYCACHCKDTHFEAIHNRIENALKSVKLCLPLQRYTFWSNSQRHCRFLSSQSYCACHCKDTHFEAIHNWKRM